MNDNKRPTWNNRIVGAIGGFLFCAFGSVIYLVAFPVPLPEGIAQMIGVPVLGGIVGFLLPDMPWSI